MRTLAALVDAAAAILAAAALVAVVNSLVNDPDEWRWNTSHPWQAVGVAVMLAWAGGRLAWLAWIGL